MGFGRRRGVRGNIFGRHVATILEQQLKKEDWYKLTEKLQSIKTLYPLNQYNYDKNTARTILEKKLNFESYEGKHCESTYTRFCQ